MQIIQVTVFQIISILVSVSFYCDHLSIYIVSVFKFFPILVLSISVTETNHFSMSFSFSYWNDTVDIQPVKSCVLLLTIVTGSLHVV